LNVGFEDVLVLSPRHRRDAIGGDDQVVACRVIIGVGDFGLEDQFHSQVSGPSLQNFQQLDAGNPAKTVPRGRNFPVFEEDINVIPVAEGVRNLRVGLFIGGPEPIHRLVREDDPPAKRIRGAVALENRDVPRRIRLLRQNGEVQPRRTAAKARDSHARAPCWIPTSRSAAASFSPVSSASAASRTDLS